MDDKNKYNNALEKLQEALAPKDGREISGLTRGCIESIFPELKESEDERIRKEIISALKYANHKGVYDKHITWLEKQGEKPQGKTALEASREEKIDNANFSQQSSAWGQEDEKNLMGIIDEIAVNKSESPESDYETYDRFIDWLKSLKNRIQPHWKPSDEQIKALEHFVRGIGESGHASPYDNDTKLIYSLLEQLKQL